MVQKTFEKFVYVAIWEKSEYFSRNENLVLGFKYILDELPNVNQKIFNVAIWFFCLSTPSYTIKHTFLKDTIISRYLANVWHNSGYQKAKQAFFVT